MKKKLLVMVMVFFSLGRIMAQEKQSSFLTLTIGPGFPIGDFAMKNLSNEAGQANTGAFLDLSYGFRFSEYSGVTAGLRGRLNSVDFSQYQLPTGSGASVEINSTTWKSAVFNVGLFQQFPLNKKKNFLFEVKGLGGVQRISSPEVNINLRMPGVTNGSSKQDSYTATSFSYLFGTAFAYNFESAIGLKLSLDYVGSRPEFKNVDGFDEDGRSAKISMKQEVNIIDLGAGLIVRF